MNDVITVKVLDQYSLFLSFDDGKEGTIDISKIIPFKGVFEPLKSLEYFKQVKVNHDIGTIAWPNGADIAPETLYEKVKKS